MANEQHINFSEIATIVMDAMKVDSGHLMVAQICSQTDGNPYVTVQQSHYGGTHWVVKDRSGAQQHSCKKLSEVVEFIGRRWW